MRSVKPMKTAKIGYIVISVALCVLGALLIVWPAFSALAIGTVMGAIMIVFGIVRLIGYFSKDLYRLAFQYDFSFGILMIVLGGIVLIKPESAMNFICIILGCAILTDGLFKIQISVDAKHFGIRKWGLILAFALLTGIVGLLLIFRPSESARLLIMLLGASLFSDGILNLSVVLTAVKIIRHQQPDIIETFDYEERKD